jgi:hypothetical protein
VIEKAGGLQRRRLVTGNCEQRLVGIAAQTEHGRHRRLGLHTIATVGHHGGAERLATDGEQVPLDQEVLPAGLLAYG